MKKLIRLLIPLICILALPACGAVPSPAGETADTWQTTAAAEPAASLENARVLIEANGTQILPYENFIWAESWTEHGFLCIDGSYISRKLSGIHHLLPQVVHDDDLALHYAENVTPTALAIYNDGFERLHRNAALTDLAELAEGEYYLVVTVKVQGKYIESEDRYESAGYEYACKLTVAE